MTGSSHWRRDIQGLRALAIIVVVLFHAGLPVPGGFIGVDVFFVISGYVITGMLRRDWQRDGRLRLRTFYARRFKRLTPALALTVSVTLLLSIVLLSPLGIQQTAAETGIGAMLLVANIVIARTTGGYFDLAAGSNPLLNTWSLSVEEQFYLVFPLILMVGWLLARRRGGRAWPTVLVAATAAASIAIMLATSRGGNLGELPGELLGFYGPLTRVWEFAAGALLVIAAPRVAGRAGATAGALLGLLLVIASLWLISSETSGPGIRNLIPVVGTVLLLWAGQRDNPVSRALASRPAVAVGDISYSWYLWHWPLIVFSLILWPAIGWVAPAAALVSLVPSLVSYRWVEQPIRTRAVTGAASWTRLIAATSGPPSPSASSSCSFAPSATGPPPCAVHRKLGHRTRTASPNAPSPRPSKTSHGMRASGTPRRLAHPSCLWATRMQGNSVKRSSPRVRLSEDPSRSSRPTDVHSWMYAR